MNTVKIKFLTADNKEYIVDAKVGESVFEAAHDNHVPLKASCEGSCACSTCHVILEEDFYDNLPEAEEKEEDMLDMAFGLTATSRLACQIIVTEEYEGKVFKIPAKTRNMA